MARQITFFKFEIGICEMKQAEDGRYDLVKTKLCEVEETSMTKSDIRKAIMDAGFECKRGADVYADKVAKVRYTFTTEALKSICEDCTVLPLD
jgi:hypothetical protein